MDIEEFSNITEGFDATIAMEKEKKDVAVLVEALRAWQSLDPYMRKEAFSALRRLLSNKKSTQDYFRQLQGVEQMLSIYQDGKHHQDREIMENSLYTLAVAIERNDFSRNPLLTPELFKLIKGTMIRKSTSSLTSAFLLQCLVSNNGDAQSLARKTKCINKLCELLKETIADIETEQSAKICNAICSTLCAMNIDPINETNQDLCCGLLLPSIVKWLYADMSRQSLHSVINLLCSCINRNSKRKTSLRVVGGLRAMVRLLDKYMYPDTVQSTEDICFLTQLINTLSCSYFSHAANQIHAIELGTVEMLLSCLVNDGIKSPQLQKTCITGLVSLLDSDDNELGKQKLQDNNGVPVLIDIMAATQDEKLKNIVTFLLHKTCNRKALSTQPSLNVTNEKIAHPTTDLCDNTPDSGLEGTQKSTSKRYELDTIITSTSQNLHSDKEILANSNPMLAIYNTSLEKDYHVVDVSNGQEKKSEICHCKNTLVVDSHTVLEVLLLNPGICEYHKAIGQAIKGHIIKKKKQLQVTSIH